MIMIKYLKIITVVFLINFLNKDIINMVVILLQQPVNLLIDDQQFCMMQENKRETDNGMIKNDNYIERVYSLHIYTMLDFVIVFFS